MREELAVTVVVPVYNAGHTIRPLLDSLDRQTMPATRWEALLVDDGSTDDTAALLDAWARTRPQVSVLHLPGSGWPSHPRNVGADRARGRYVFFVDADDWLGDRALERMHAYGTANDADVVIGRMVGVGREVPRRLFDHDVPHAQLPQDPLYDSLTSHAMFRRGFLADIDLRFEEHAARLEDHLFVTEAYLRAQTVSVLAGEDCYFHAARDDGRGIGVREYSARGYYTHLRAAIASVLRLLPDGPARDRYLGRWLRRELLGRLRSEAVRYLPPAVRAEFFAEIRSIAFDGLTDGARAGLNAVDRERLAALHDAADPASFYAADDRITRRHAPARGRIAALRAQGLRMATRATGGRATRTLAEWARTPAVLARHALLAVATGAAAAAVGCAASRRTARAVPWLAAASGSALTALAGRSTPRPLVVGCWLLLSAAVPARRPWAALTVRRLAPASVAVAGGVVMRALARRDVRGYPARPAHGVTDRVGRIGVVAACAGAAVVAATSLHAPGGR